MSLFRHVVSFSLTQNLCIHSKSARCLVNYNRFPSVRFSSTKPGDPKVDTVTGVELRPVNKERSCEVPLEMSLEYMDSEAYSITYRGEPVWKPYRRNHKGTTPPLRTRKSCIKNGKIITGSPCPLCRDEYLVLDYRNVNLLKQFISEDNGEIFGCSKTGVCQRKQMTLLGAIKKAFDYGTIAFDVPFRQYEYSDYAPK